ncbi:MAG TPA: carboxypeptidase regulatory-like domain-containing protein [Bryobacteraceae bacterium]|nr:carboxypeptidase regulatory-like domain-containing protein [Bryobacteraceae bacterium]
MRWIFVVFCALAAVAAAAQDRGTLEGAVRDSKGRPLAAVTVSLRMHTTGQTLTAHTDAAGAYRFTGLHAATYLLSAEGGASGKAAARPVTLLDRETKKVDLTLDQYAFSDEPNFIVAGVIDPTSHGGHGSDTVRRSTEELAKAAAALSEERPGVAEKREDALQTAREYGRAAELEPSEPHLFNWGTELLMHRAAEPAAEVFAKGHRLFPRSPRMLLGLAAAWYAQGDYAHAAQRFFEACDLNPADPGPYMFLGKVQSTEITGLQGYVERLARFANLHPENPWANYYYSVALWKQREGPDDSGTPTQARALLEKAVRLDPAMGAAYLQLGIVYSAQSDDARAIAAYQKAIEVGTEIDEAHYRLGQAYERTGQKDKGRQELETYERMSKTVRQQIDRERSEIQQFVFELRDNKDH